MNKEWFERFSVGRLQDFLTITRLIKRHGGDVRQIEDYLARKKHKVRQVKSHLTHHQIRWKNKAPCCPVCGATLFLRAIALPPGRGNENGYRSEWYCAAKDCVYEKYSTLTAEEQLKRYGLEA
jgi:hypothetical protein